MRKFSELYLNNMGLRRGNPFEQFFCKHKTFVTNLEEINVNRSRYYDICNQCGKTLVEGAIDYPLDTFIQALQTEHSPEVELFINGHKYYKN